MTGTKGERVYPDSEGHLWLRKGQYGQDVRGNWVVRPPGPFQRAGVISDTHTVGEFPDGTITVCPSIVRMDESGFELWQGWLQRGVWHDA
tara:strand:+ start:2178 stop:2447 length:270 start_codon:yes stop_codon:yes gene_type:complete